MANGPVLWHLELSHYSEKVRWALDHKRIPHVRRTPLPGAHGLPAMLVTRGAHRRLPVIRLPDGRTIGDSTAIIAALEERWPERPLYPEDKARALALEEFFDEQLGSQVRRVIWHHTLPDPDAVVDALLPAASGARRRLTRTLLPAFAPVVRADYGVSAERAKVARDAVLAAIERIESELQPSGYLVGDSFSVADMTAAALASPAVWPPQHPHPPARLVPAIEEFCAEVRGRPGGQWVLEMYARHRLPSAERP